MTELISAPVDIPPNADPDDLDGEYQCTECRRTLTYSGRGRKPKRCSERNNGDPDCYGKSQPKSGGTKRTTSAEKLAEEAAAVLCGLNDLTGMGFFFVGLQRTASVIAAGNDAFRERAIAALVLDPNMSKMILRGGTKSAAMALGMAYLSFAVPVVKTASMEIRANKEMRRAENVEESPE